MNLLEYFIRIPFVEFLLVNFSCFLLLVCAFHLILGLFLAPHLLGFQEILMQHSFCYIKLCLCTLIGTILQHMIQLHLLLQVYLDNSRADILDSLFDLSFLFVLLLGRLFSTLVNTLEIFTSGVTEKLRDKEKELDLSLSALYVVAIGPKRIGTSANFMKPTRLSTHSGLISFKCIFFTSSMMKKS